MSKYEEQIVWCSQCRQKVPFTFGAKSLCAGCYKVYYGNTKALTAMEQKLIAQEEEIADLQTIINLMKDMSKKISDHNAMIENTE